LSGESVYLAQRGDVIVISTYGQGMYVMDALKVRAIK
jgi:hypothetical protein